MRPPVFYSMAFSIISLYAEGNSDISLSADQITRIDFERVVNHFTCQCLIEFAQTRFFVQKIDYSIENIERRGPFSSMGMVSTRHVHSRIPWKSLLSAQRLLSYHGNSPVDARSNHWPVKSSASHRFIFGQDLLSQITKLVD